MWLVLALLSAIFHALYFALSKKFLQTINQHIFAAGTFLAASFILFVVSFFNGFPAVEPRFLIAAFSTTVLNVITTIFMYKALKITDLSLAAPMISFTPIFLILTSYILLKESPTAIGAIGILLVVFGSYVLNIKSDVKEGVAGEPRSVFEPFKRMFNDKGILLMLGVAFLYSISTNFDKLVVLRSDPIFGSAFVYLILGFIFLIISLAKKIPFQEFKNNVVKFLGVGLVIALAAVAINSSLAIQIVPYVISVKRFSALFSVILGWLFFKEKAMWQKILGAVVMVAGTLFIIFA